MVSSCNHCLTISAMDAEAREHTREENHRALIQTADAGAWNGGVRALVARDCCVELTKFELMEKLFSWDEIRWRTSSVGSVGSGCSNWYDWTLKAVRTAENRPAYGT